MSSRPSGSTPRCAAHPSRPAVDDCPVCARPRCDTDRQRGNDCLVCAGGAPPPPAAPPDRELLVRAALAAHGSAVAGGYVSSEYVGADLFMYLTPFVLGIVCGYAAAAAARHPGPGVLGTRLRALAVLYAVLCVGFGFVLEGTYGVFSLSLDVLAPYALAGAGAWLWTTPPRRRPRT